MGYTRKATKKVENLCSRILPRDYRQHFALRSCSRVHAMLLFTLVVHNYRYFKSNFKVFSQLLLVRAKFHSCENDNNNNNRTTLEVREVNAWVFEEGAGLVE